MEYKGPGRRREPRFPIETDVDLQRPATGDALPAKSVNLSGGGMLLKLEQPATLHVGEEVTCALRVPDDAGKPLPLWGVGNVVRVENGKAAIELQAGTFEPKSDPKEQ